MKYVKSNHINLLYATLLRTNEDISKEDEVSTILAQQELESMKTIFAKINECQPDKYPVGIHNLISKI